MRGPFVQLQDPAMHRRGRRGRGIPLRVQLQATEAIEGLRESDHDPLGKWDGNGMEMGWKWDGNKIEKHTTNIKQTQTGWDKPLGS